MEDSDNKPATSFPLFKGATRTPMFMGVPLLPLILAVFFVFIVAMTVSIFCWALLIPIIFVMQQIVKHDDKAFGTWGLWIDTKLRNTNKRFWNASSYAPATYKRKRKKYVR
ncbi:type IV secretion system protein VirB3 [Xanthomonas euvesicatoria]|uniref:type IV secretion system protein VirB3 n=1 Tax=Xanthomonas euvesicatoria TaxID=456327 RepID=UPI0009D3DE70|nr:VirB3 family type IV secretion system protein [Xanthomonas euvesicatoria]MBV6800008.1 VirB3 family type IV secretion system protein [Xanthomonas campestris pv. obscurae]OOX22851.1 TrwM protein [Xanthomonas campestris pv. azadirachtae]